MYPLNPAVDTIHWSSQRDTSMEPSVSLSNRYPLLLMLLLLFLLLQLLWLLLMLF